MPRDTISVAENALSERWTREETAPPAQNRLILGLSFHLRPSTDAACMTQSPFELVPENPRALNRTPGGITTNLATIPMSATDVFGRFLMTTLTFEDLTRRDGEKLGVASNPYAVIGLTISNALVKTNANVNSCSRGVALKSTRFPPEASVNRIDLRFMKPQGGFGFFYCTSRATPLRVKVLDSNETELEEDVFHDREGYAGVMRAKAEIGLVRIVTGIESPDTAEGFCFYIDDLSFGKELKAGY
jgi:hypothetical protein